MGFVSFATGGAIRPAADPCRVIDPLHLFFDIKLAGNITSNNRVDSGADNIDQY
jgi:hypothetical protein